MTGAESPGGDLAQLREEFPGWSFGSHHQPAATGPGGQTWFALRGEELVSALTPAGLAEQIRERERQ